MGQTTLNQKTSDFGTFGRYTEIPVDQMTSEQRKGYELVVQQRGEATPLLSRQQPRRGAYSIRREAALVFARDRQAMRQQ